MSKPTLLVPVILAAGQGTRMNSLHPKVLQSLAGNPLINYVLDTAYQLDGLGPVIVLGHGADEILDKLNPPIPYVLQEPQLGTGHALQKGLSIINNSQVRVLVLYGDVPLIRLETLQQLIAIGPTNGLSILTATLADPTGYGRVLRDNNDKVVGIVEERDANEIQRALHEVNTGIMVAPYVKWMNWLSNIKCDNDQGEFYLTDCIALAAKDGVPISTHRCHDVSETMGVNNREQLAAAECALRNRRATKLMNAGVTLCNPEFIEIRGDIKVGKDVVIDAGVVLEGSIQLGDGVRIGPFCSLRNCTLGSGVEILSHTSIDGANVDENSKVGPFARIRPGTDLSCETNVGNFVEVKNTKVGPKSKINHLSYVGDACLGSQVNIGAGTITCNYDGINKNKTLIEDGAFIGSNTALVAPLRVGKNATIGAGSVITHDAPDQKLTLGRARQSTVNKWQRPKKDTE